MGDLFARLPASEGQVLARLVATPSLRFDPVGGRWCAGLTRPWEPPVGLVAELHRLAALECVSVGPSGVLGFVVRPEEARSVLERVQVRKAPYRPDQLVDMPVRWLHHAGGVPAAAFVTDQPFSLLMSFQMAAFVSLVRAVDQALQALHDEEWVALLGTTHALRAYLVPDELGGVLNGKARLDLRNVVTHLEEVEALLHLQVRENVYFAEVRLEDGSVIATDERRIADLATVAGEPFHKSVKQNVQKAFLRVLDLRSAVPAERARPTIDMGKTPTGNVKSAERTSSLARGGKRKSS